MPTYDFICVDCGFIEITKGMMEPNPTICPRCKKPGLAKRFTPITKIMYGNHYVGGNKPGFGKIGKAEIAPREG